MGEIEDKRAEKEKRLQEKTNSLTAYLLTLLVILGGAVLFGVVYATGFFSVWISFLLAFLAMFVFRRFKKNGSAGMIIYVLLLSAFFNLVSMIIGKAVAIMLHYSGYAFADCLVSSIKLIYTVNTWDPILCVVFTTIGVFSAYASIKAQEKKKDRVVENPNMQMPIQQPLANNQIMQQNVVPQPGVSSDQKMAAVMVDEMREYVRLRKENLIEQDEFIKLVEVYNQSVISAIPDDQKTNIILLYAKPYEDQYRDMARKILIKLLAK